MKGLKELNALRSQNGYSEANGRFSYSSSTGLPWPTSRGGKPVEWFATRGLPQLSAEAREARRPPSPAEQLDYIHEPPPATNGRGAKTVRNIHSSVVRKSRTSDIRADLAKILGTEALSPERFNALVEYVEGVAR